MLTPNYLQKLPNELVEYFQELEDDVMKDVIKRINKTSQLTGTAENEIKVLIDMGYDLGDVKKEIQAKTKIGEKKLNKLINQASLESYANDAKMYKKGGKTLSKFKNNNYMQDIIKTFTEQADADLNNLTKTLGMNGLPLEEYYKKTLSKSLIKIKSGAFSPEETIRDVINEMGDNGLQVINYHDSGRNMKVESAVRMCLNTAVNGVSAMMALRNAEDMEQDLMEITAHAGARPSHAEWQGRIVSLSGRDGYLSLGDIGYGDPAGFMGVNCRHNWYPYFEGVSQKNWSEAELENINPPDFEYEDRTYNFYEATQKQRYMERGIRKSKRKLEMYKEVKDNEKITAEKIRLNKKRKEYREFSKRVKSGQKNVRTRIFKKT